MPLLESMIDKKVYLTTYYYLMLYRPRTWVNNEYVCGLWCRFRYRCTDDVISGYILSMTNWILLCMVPDASFWQLNLQKKLLYMILTTLCTTYIRVRILYLYISIVHNIDQFQAALSKSYKEGYTYYLYITNNYTLHVSSGVAKNGSSPFLNLPTGGWLPFYP